MLKQNLINRKVKTEYEITKLKFNRGHLNSMSLENDKIIIICPMIY